MSALENIKKALDGATPGPWKCVSEPNFDSGLVYTSVQPVNVDDEAMKPLAMANGEYHVCRMSHSAAPWRFNYHRKNAQYIAAVNPVAIAELLSTLEIIREASANLIASASDTYKKRNGHLASFEDESGEKCWIVPFDAFEALRSALPNAEPVKTAPPLDCETCNGTGKEARHQICRDCDEATPSVAAKSLELDGVPDALAYGKGIWRTCTGCYESNEGYPTGPFSDTLKCHLGGGCFECGGIGAVWDTTDYEDMGNFIALSAQVQNVAAKSLADAYQKYLDASDLYNERLAISKTKALGTMRVDEEYRAIDEARRAFDKLAVEIAKSALTAAPAKQEG